MEKLLLSFLCLILAISAVGQKIAWNTVDDFTGERKIETNIFKPLKAKDRAFVNPIEMYFKSVDNVPFFVVSTTYLYSYVRTNDKLYFLDDNGNKYTYRSVGDTRSAGIYIGDFESLIGKNVTKFRMEFGEKSIDFAFDKKHYNSLSTYYQCIKTELFKYYSELAEFGRLKHLVDSLERKNTIDPIVN